MSSASPSAQSRTLTLPDAWAAELCDLRNPDLAEPVVGPVRLVLSYDPKRSAGWGAGLDEVAADLSAGMTLRPDRPHRGQDRYVLTGSLYRVQVTARPVKGRTWPLLAVVTQVTFDDARLARRAGRLSRPVVFAKVWEEQSCDIGLLHREVEQPQRRQREVVDASRALRHGHRDRASFRHAELHAEARRRYHALRALLVLLRLRAERQAVTVEGTVVTDSDEGDAADPFLNVEVAASKSGRPSPVLQDFADAYVEIESVTVGGRPSRTVVRDVTDRALVLDVPTRGDWAPGTLVTVTTKPRFAMGQNDAALGRFLQGQVEGNWDDLAALLCKPGRLPLVPPPLPARFFCDEDPDEKPLNDEQRKAVAGAVATPHAYVIQGPPGTGKTTVICETVRQLVARRERVLLLAPSHVAVDEVLRRIGPKPGIRPLRFAWDESKVDEALRGYLPDRAGRQYAAAVRAAGPESDERWQARRAGLLAERDALDRLLAALVARGEATSSAERAVTAAVDARRRLEEARQHHAATITDCTARLTAAESAYDASARFAEQARADEDSARQEREAARPPVDELLAAVRALARASAELPLAAGEARAASQRRQAWDAGWRADLDRRAAIRRDLEDRAGLTVAAAGDAFQRLQVAQAELEALPTERGPLARLADRLGVGARTRAAAATRRAHAAWQQVEQERLGYEQHWRRLVGEQEQLHACEQAEAGRLGEIERAAGAHWQVADVAMTDACARWDAATLAATGAPRPRPPDPAALEPSVVTALEGRDELPELVGYLVPSDFRRAHVRHRAAVAARVRQQADRLTHEEQLAQERAALQEAVAASEADEARLGADGDAAEAVAGERRADQEAAERALGQAATVLGYEAPPTPGEAQVRRARVDRQVHVLPSFPALRRRWQELVADLTGDDISQAVGDALERAANVVCATTTGTSPLPRDVDFDTLIVDESSRVVDSEFLVGAVRARRWVLVGDEHQLPPFVDNKDEHLLHALAALHRHERGAAASIEEAVAQLAGIWTALEDEEQRQFRTEEVVREAGRLRARHEWPDVYGEAFRGAHQRLANEIKDDDGDADRELLATMRRHLAQSLLERVVAGNTDIRQPLVYQRRMVRPMARIVRGPIYGGHYKSPTDDELRRGGVRPLTTSPTFSEPVVLLDTRFDPRCAEEPAGHGYINQGECDWVVEACRRYETEMRSDEREVKVSVLCFYQAQAQLIRSRLKPPGAAGHPDFQRLKFARIASIDSIQGQEADLVIVAFTRSNPRPGQQYGQWLQDVRRLNVACTRAHRALVLVGNSDMLQRLRTRRKAQGFYGNLFALFRTDGDFRVIDDFLASGDSGR